MTYPTSRDWIFSVKTFAASMLALYIGLKLELPRPYWAMATVYIVSNPFVGATRSKALYRAQLCVHAGRLHHAADRAAFRDEP